mmetsp:Transcript_46206/g.121151  ORF Transcript_46206/g.121151 Transcript_46206/m.121151 type:complete len:215 (+) Transcript_46206:2520-3164(+)
MREALEPEDIDGADEEARLAAIRERLIDTLDEDVEEARVEGPGERVLRRHCICRRVRLGNPVEARLDVQRADGLRQLVRHAAEETRGLVNGATTLEHGVVVAAALEGGVAHVQQGCDDFPHRLDVRRHRRDAAHRLLQLSEAARELFPLDARLVAHVEVSKRVPRAHPVLRALGLWQVSCDLVKYVIVLLVGELRGDARLLEEVGVHLGTYHAP